MARGRHGARRLLVQAIYQRQLAGHSAEELVDQFSVTREYRGIDTDYFRNLIGEIVADERSLDALIADAADRPVAQLDPVERAVLWLGLMELRSHPDVPTGVVINEAIDLAREFGAQDSFRYINAVLDTIALRLRAPAS